MFRIPYGYTLAPDSRIIIHEQEAANVQFIYQSYLAGDSLGRIADKLEKAGIALPHGNQSWTRAMISKILSNSKYAPHIISEDQFYEALMEKSKRSNIDMDTEKRKTARYNSQNVLNGLLICGECGRNYRRITRPSGEVVWRCADKVEKGKRAACSNMVTMSDEEIKEIICEYLGLENFDEAAILNGIDLIEIGSAGIIVQMKTVMTFGSMAW
jgi:hypothetical protein